MLNLGREELVTLTAAAKLIPAANGKRPHVCTLWRWCRKGIKGVRLEYVRVGSRIFTSVDALNRFVNALADADQQGTENLTSQQPARVDTLVNRKKSIADAQKVLKQAGI